MTDQIAKPTTAKLPEPAHRFAAVRRTPVYRAVVDAWHAPVMLACSGGADSMGLLVSAAVARAAGRVGPAIVVHIDHRTRPETRREEDLVRDQARRFGLPYVSVTVDEASSHNAGGTEAALRDLRYRRLARLGATLGIDTVVTAHTRNDQVETVLMRLLAGSSPLAAAGMNRASELSTVDGGLRVLRPLLDVERQDLLAVLEISATLHAEDPSNLDPRYRRNRIRHELVPLLEDLESGSTTALLRTIDLAKQDAEVVDMLALDAFDRHVRQDGDVWTVRRDILRDQPDALGGRVLKMVFERLAGGDTREVSRERIVSVLAAARGRTGAVIELPYGIRARIERDRVVLAMAPGVDRE